MNKFQSILFCFFSFLSSSLFAQNTNLVLLENSKKISEESRQTILFNDNWKFHKGDVANANKQNFNDKDWRQLDLPHDWSIEGPFDEQWSSGTAYLPAGIGWYRKTFEINSAIRSKNICIYFDGVYNNSEVWINDHYLGKRPNGFIPFYYELTKYLNKYGKNILSVKVDHSQFADSRWYTGSGIYRNVYLIAKSPVSIDVWGTAFSATDVSSQKANAKISVSITNHSLATSDLIVKYSLVNSSGKPVAQNQESLELGTGNNIKTDMNLSIANPSLWSVEHPELYKLQIKLYKNGKEIDNEEQHVGFRSIRFDKDKGFFLNNKNVKLKGVCVHDDAGALGVAVPEEVWERRLKILKDGGCNSIRLSHNPHADYLYDLCDRMGILVMDEAFDEWELGKNKWIKGWNVGKPGQDGYHEYFKEWADKDLSDMILRDRNHPSIILWSIGNEIDYPNDPYTHEILNTGKNPQIYGKGYSPDHPSAARLQEIAKHLVEVIKAIDTTRPVTAALAGVVMSNEVGYPEELDVVGYNYQEFRYPDDHKKYPNRIIYGSENGMQADAWKAVTDNDYIAGQYLWTGIDYLGEAHKWPARSSDPGLIDLAGFTKPEYYFRQSLWSDKPMVYISTNVISNKNSRQGRNTMPSWNYKVGDSVMISCFTNCTSTELFLNSRSLGKKNLADAEGKIITWKTIYHAGELLVKGYNNNKEVSNFKIKTAGEPYAIKAAADKHSFSATKKQLTHVEINIVDKNGVIVPDAGNEVTVVVEGPAKLLGLESGSIVSHEDYKSNKRKALNGKLLAYIQSTQQTGNVKITIKADGLQAKVINILMR